MAHNRHEERVVIVTGASSGIGRRIAIEFASEGATVVCASPDNEAIQGKHYDTDITVPTEELIQTSESGNAVFVETDVSQVDSVQNLVDETMDQFGQIDVLVNNAGILIPGDSQELTADEWEESIGVDLDGAFYCMKFSLPHIKETEGDIINIGSVNATEGGIGPAYTAAKAGVVNLTRDIAVEAGEHNVTVNSISPGFIKTPAQDVTPPEDIEYCKEHTLLPRLGEPEDVAQMAVFLASDDAAFVHGADFLVDGGWAAHRM